MKKFLIGLVIAGALACAGIAAFLTTVDANQYRGRIAEELSRKTGRKVSLDGPITLGLSWNGVNLLALDASIGNPSWANHPVMASIGRLELGISFPPLLHRQLVITSLNIVHADIDLETGSDDKNNWNLTPNEHRIAPAPPKERQGGSVAMHVDSLSVADSQVAFHAKDGSASVFKVAKMSVGGIDGASVHLETEYNGAPFVLNIKTGADDLLPPGGAWPFSADLSYSHYDLTVEGKADLDDKNVTVSQYEIKTGGSTVNGEFATSWKDKTPLLHGTVTSDSMALADFTTAPDKKAVSVRAKGPKAVELPRVFSDTPLALDGLKAVNAVLDVKIDKMVLANGTLNQTSATLNVQDGLLSAPFKTVLGGGTVNGQIKLSDATSPPQFSVLFSAPGVELADFLRMISAPAFLSGKADVEINLAGTGDSTRAMAGSAVGIINLVAAGGNVSDNSADDLPSTLMQLFSPGGSNTLNCLAARFIVKDGIARDNGILVDTSATTVAGKGGFNLGNETLDIILHAKTKHVNVGMLLPAATVSGVFLEPHYSVDPSDVVRNVAGILTSGDISGGVPDVMTHPGDNACVYTLEHSDGSTSSSQSVSSPPGLLGRANDTLKNVSNALKGWLGQ